VSNAISVSTPVNEVNETNKQSAAPSGKSKYASDLDLLTSGSLLMTHRQGQSVSHRKKVEQPQTTSSHQTQRFVDGPMTSLLCIVLIVIETFKAFEQFNNICFQI